jgi:CelD/BcsL family acetyltransferase involved in cellulose biosynthesis
VQVDAVEPGELDPEQVARWEELRRACPWAASPFFSAAYTQAVGAFRPETRVAVVEDGGRVLAFLPFERRRRRALPVGPGLTDYQGSISQPDASWPATELLSRLGLTSYSFDHVPTTEPHFLRHVRHRTSSPVLDLAGGFDAYVKEARGTERDGPSEALRKRRRLERAAEVRFEPDDQSPEALATLLGWKSEQHRRTGSLPVFEIPWVRDVLERVRETRSEELTGMLSSLYADGALVAANLGLRSGRLLHSWVFGFDMSWAKFSPGSILTIAMAEALPALGLEAYDFGKGPEPYKRRFANKFVELGEGAVTVGPRAGVAAWVRPKALRAAMATPLAGPIGRLHHRRLFGV